MHKMALQLTGDKYFKDVHPEDIMDACLLAALSIFFPMQLGDGDATVFHVPDSVGNLIFGLKAPMAGSVVYKDIGRKGNLRKTVALGLSKADEGSNQAAKKKPEPKKTEPKKKKQRTAAPEEAEAGGEEALLSKKEILRLQKQEARDNATELTAENMEYEDGTLRQKVWFDDMVTTIFWPIQKISYKHWSNDKIQIYIQTAFSFMLNKIVRFQGTEYKTWSTLRRALRTEVVRSHSKYINQVPGVAAAGGDPSAEDLTKIVQHLLGEADDDHLLYEPVDENTKRITELLEDVPSLQDLEAFLKAIEVNRPVKFHSPYTEYAGKMHDKILRHRQESLKDDIPLVFSHVVEEVCSVIPSHWMEVAATMANLNRDGMEAVALEQLDNLFPSDALIAKFLQLRAKYILECFQALWEPGTKAARAADFLQVHVEGLCEMDIGIASEHSVPHLHETCWRKVLDEALKVMGKKKPEQPLPSFLSACQAAVKALVSAAAAADSDDMPELVIAEEVDAPPPTPPAPQKLEEPKQPVDSLHSVVSAWATDPSCVRQELESKGFLDPTSSAVQLFKTSVEFALQQRCLPGFGELPDQGYGSLVPVEKGTGLLFKGGALKKLRLSYFGAITAVPVEGSIPCCTAFGAPWYIHAPSDNKFQLAGSNSFVPAFAIPVAKNKDSPTMSFEKSTFQHEFLCRPAGLKSDKKFTTEITLYSLVLSVDSQKKEDIILTRPANDVIMKAKNIAKPKKFAKTQKGGIPHEWRAYEHLLK